MNAIQFLLKEHNNVRRQFADIESTASFSTRKKMFDALCKELIKHEKMEQQFWYPHFKNDKNMDEKVQHLIAEEKEAASTIKQFEAVSTQEHWEKIFEKFKKNIEHHAFEEEHKLFPKVENILSTEQLEKIGKQMQEFKNQ